ncbi:MAG: heme ABC transporter permease [Alphaproteobacteria bacterium]|nr:heme ABC transporter permease [Alphaproteobacteria bacterium]
MHRFANPARFLRIARWVVPWSASLGLVSGAAGLYLGLAGSPADYQQGDTVRIMYVHVPAAWMALAAYATMALASAVALIWKHPLADLIAKSTAPIGATFTAIALITGALWGQPTWGTWWVWDARLTSVLILLFLYVGYLALWNAFDDPTRAARAAAVLALVGVVNLPIIKFSVDWWNTLHQPASVLKIGGPTIHPAMLTPLLLMALAFLCYFITLLLLRVRGELAARKLRALQAARAEG